MGIRSRIKKRLPIFGRQNNAMEEPPADLNNEAVSPSGYTPEPYTPPKSPRGEEDVQTFLERFVTENKIVIFMKGSPASPSCGFSANASAILTSYGVEYKHFDVFLDQDVREGVKDYSQWPTLPQIYLNGEFIGGSDILTQMHQNGELKAEIDAMT
jgi:monothiol glutaredoxin